MALPTFLARDSAIWWLGIFGGLIVYLNGQTSPTEWGYYQWLSAVGYVISVVSAKLSTAPQRSQFELLTGAAGGRK